jgi:Response regulator containing CheY-like receiver, AAA-type ATPase, and DNA-binding domains
MKTIEPKKIFIVDDDEMLTEALSDYLTREVDHVIKVFYTGEEFIEHIDENPDVVILDYYLNTVQKDAANGLEVLEMIHDHLKNTRVIMLSSQESYVTAAKTIQKGALQYVIKDEDAFEKIANSI